jgi:hypothetical protein
MPNKAETTHPWKTQIAKPRMQWHEEMPNKAETTHPWKTQIAKPRMQWHEDMPNKAESSNTRIDIERYSLAGSSQN